MKKNITIKDIARELDVHHTTVSLALRNSNSIKKETRDKIWQKARELGYRPNRLAQGFRNRRTNTIGVLVPDIQHHIFSRFISNITELANKVGFSVMVFQSNEQLDTEKKNVDALIDNRVAGVIVSISKETNDGKHFKAFAQENIPLVFFDRVPDDVNEAKVLVDNFQGSYEVVNLLINSGRKKIAFITGSSQINVYRDRLDGYLQALKVHGISFRDELLVKGGFYMEDGMVGARKLMKLPEKPDAILAVGDEVGIGVIKYLKSIGMYVPQDIAVVGFDNDPMGIAVEPELTTVKQPVQEMAKMAFNLLMKKIDDNATAFESKPLKPEIIVRESS